MGSLVDSLFSIYTLVQLLDRSYVNRAIDIFEEILNADSDLSAV